MIVDIGERGKIGQCCGSDGEAGGHSRFRITMAVAQPADLNSTEVCADAGTSGRAIGSKPNFGKNRSPIPEPRHDPSTATDRSKASSSDSSRADLPMTCPSRRVTSAVLKCS
jgi:hypothetical protein